MGSEEKKRYRDRANRANRARRALLKEKEQRGYIRDGSGKRYRTAVFYILAGANDKALDFYSWFETEFPDDVGEPIFDFYWALVEFRVGNIREASNHLKVAMLSNLYMLPYIFHEPIEQLDIWHSSNREHNSYLWEIEEYLDEPTDIERQWIKNEYHSQPFIALRNGYISTYHSLNYEHDFHNRCKILEKWRQLSEELFENNG